MAVVHFLRLWFLALGTGRAITGLYFIFSRCYVLLHCPLVLNLLHDECGVKAFFFYESLIENPCIA